MLPKSSVEERLAQPLVWIIAPHVDLSKNDIFFLRDLRRRQRGMQNSVRKQINGYGRMLRRKVYIVHRAVESRVRIDITAVRLDSRRDLASLSSLGPLKKHMLEVM